MKYIDLALPSGTLWADCNVGAEKPQDYGDYFNFEDAQKCGTLPTCEQWAELEQHCKLLWNLKEKQLEIVGPNGKKIILPAAGYRLGTSFDYVGIGGNYWSNSFSATNAYNAGFSSSSFYSKLGYYRYYGFTVRLIKNRH